MKKVPPVVSELSDAGDLRAAAGMAGEWAGAVFDESRVMKSLSANRDGEVALLATCAGETAGLLRGMMTRLWSDDAPSAFAPLVWARGLNSDGGKVLSRIRDRTMIALGAAFVDWAKGNGAASARMVLRTGTVPDKHALDAAGWRPEFRVCVRRVVLPGDVSPGRAKWFSTEARAAREWELDLPPERMFPELFAESPDFPPATRRLAGTDEDAALEVVRRSRVARGLAFSESGFRKLFRGAIGRRDCCALAVEDERPADAGGGGLAILMCPRKQIYYRKKSVSGGIRGFFGYNYSPLCPANIPRLTCSPERADFPSE